MNDLRDFLQLFTSIIAASVGLVLFWYNDTIPINEKIFITAIKNNETYVYCIST